MNDRNHSTNIFFFGDLSGKPGSPPSNPSKSREGRRWLLLAFSFGNGGGAATTGYWTRRGTMGLLHLTFPRGAVNLKVFPHFLLRYFLQDSTVFLRRKWTEGIYWPPELQKKSNMICFQRVILILHAFRTSRVYLVRKILWFDESSRDFDISRGRLLIQQIDTWYMYIYTYDWYSQILYHSPFF